MENKTYGNNMTISFCNRKKIIGIKKDAKLVFAMLLIFILTFTGYILCFWMFYHFSLIIISSILFFLTIYNYLLCFFKEPGIIPRKSELFKLDSSKMHMKDLQKTEENKIFQENKILSTAKGQQTKKSTIVNNNSSEEIIKEIKSMTDQNIKEEKQQKKIINIFPEFKDEDEVRSNVANGNELNNTFIFVKEEAATVSTLSNQTNSNKNNYEKTVIENNKINNSLIFSSEIGNNNSDNKDNNVSSINPPIPLIFQSKACHTCEIMRPPKASHCKICDNCILNKDHHCIYVSNCIGERNHKNFFLFLLNGSILSIFTFLTSIYHIIYIFFLYENNITKEIYSNGTKYLFFIDLLLLFTSILLFFVNKYLRIISYCVYSSFVILFIIVFYINVYKKKKQKITFDKGYHPFSIVVISVVVPLMVFVVNNFYKQLIIIGKGLTIKQYDSISNQRREMKKQKNPNYIIMDMYIKAHFSIGNIWQFFRKKNKKSLINEY